MPSSGAVAGACSSRSSTSRSGVGVDHALRGWQRRLAAGDQPAAPAQRCATSGRAGRRGTPASMRRSLHISASSLDLLRIRLLPRGEERRVDAAGRDAGQDVGNDVGKLARQIAQHADLIRAARAAAAQHERQALRASVAHLARQNASRDPRATLRQRLPHDFVQPAMMDFAPRPSTGLPPAAARAGLCGHRDPDAGARHRRHDGALHGGERGAARAAAVPRLEQAGSGVAQRAAGADLRVGVVRALSRLAAAPARLHRPRRVVAARLHDHRARKARSARPAPWPRRRSSASSARRR